MFSFHKPKIYRSSLGCCICKAKSSSSRFTDSKKYENEFERCFRIKEKRSGEICNACVLLVKRWKKLSPENRLVKHWNHVVDARAGPGTKLNSNRRLVNNNSGSESKQVRQANSSGQTGASSSKSTEALPLSSSHSGNHQSLSSSNSNHQQQQQQQNHQQQTSSTTTTHNKRSNSFSKALAIDTNVSTFTFGEPRRRYYDSYNPYSSQSYAYTTNSSSIYSSSASSSTSSSSYAYTFSKPQSALSSSAFESVMKRFRQRQQQEELKNQRREHNRQLKQLHLQQKRSSSSINTNSPSKQIEKQDIITVPKVAEIKCKETGTSSSLVGYKRQKRSSESSIGSQDSSLRVCPFLDSSMWRRERICCGVIFRGLNNEVVVFPKFLKPCEARLSKLKRIRSDVEDASSVEPSSIEAEQSPPPRTTKSGSISSCDSNTSGTGSMENSAFEQVAMVQRPTSLVSKGISRQAYRKQRIHDGLDEDGEQIKSLDKKQGRQRRCNQSIGRSNESRSDGHARLKTKGGRKRHLTLTSSVTNILSPSESSETSSTSGLSSSILMGEEEEGDEAEIDEEEDDDDDEDEVDADELETSQLILGAF